MMRFCLAALLSCWIAAAQAQVAVAVCHDYGCANETEVVFGNDQLGEIALVLDAASSAEDERQRLSLVMAQLYAWAGEKSPVWRDRAGNYLDDGMPGTMDCIDHSTTTTRFLLVLSDLKLLRYHRVLAPQYRGRLFTHYSAVIEEVDADGIQSAEGDDRGQYVVDSWFGDHGTPALIIPIEEWREGGGPDV